MLPASDVAAGLVAARKKWYEGFVKGFLGRLSIFMDRCILRVTSETQLFAVHHEALLSDY